MQSVGTEQAKQTIKEKLDSMPMEEFVVLLEGCADKSKVKTSEQAEIISQLEHQMKVQPEEAIPSLTNAKYSSSLQSLLHKDKGKNHHKVATSTGINNRPGDLYQHYQQSQNVTNCSAATTVIPSVVFPVSSSTVATNNLPAQYYFNCTQDVCQPPSNQGRAVGVEEVGPHGIPEPHSVQSPSLVPEHDTTSVIRNKSNIQLSESYASISTVTTPSTGQSSLSFENSTEASYSNESSPEQLNVRLPVVFNQSQTATLVTPQTISVTQSGFSQVLTGSCGNYPSSNSSLTKSSSDHRKPIPKKGKGRGLRETNLVTNNIPGFRGDGDVDDLVQFVEGTPVGKRGNKKKERENRGKSYVNDILVKSMSLDDDNLSFATKKTGDRGDRATSLKDAVNVRSERGRIEKDKKDKDFGKAVSSLGTKKSLANQGNRRESDQEDNKSPLRDQAEPKFTVVMRKRKNKTACTTSPTGSTTGKEVEQRKDSRRSRSRGDRRKSVGSVPSLDQSEGSDDCSVRSLPTGECTKREDVPKSCASSGSTPQTSYADIARLTSDEENKKVLSQAIEDYPSLHGSENSEVSDIGSDGFVPMEDVDSKEICVKSQPCSGGTPLTSYADIARLASHEEKKDDKKDHTSEDFPELNSTVVGAASQESSTELLPSPVTKYGSNNSAFPQLTSGSASKLTFTQGLSNQKTMSSVVSSSPNPATGTYKVSNSLPVSSNSVARAPTPTSKAQLNSASPATMGTSVPPSSAKSNVNNVSSVEGNARCVNNKPASHAAPARVLNSPTNVTFNSAPDVDCSRAKFKSQVCPNEKSLPKDVDNIVVNGHVSDSDKDKEIIRSDILGAKAEKSAFSVTAPLLHKVGSGLAGQCTEAVVFCGENFKEPPQFASKNLEMIFGFDVNEALVDIDKQISPDSPFGSKNVVNKKQSKIKHVPSPPPKEVQDGIYQQSQNKHTYTGTSDDHSRLKQQDVRNRNQLGNRNVRNLDSKLQPVHQDRNQPNKGSQHRIAHNAKKSAQGIQPALSDGSRSVSSQMASPDSYKNSTVVTTFPLNVNPVHIGSGIPSTVYGIPGYIPGAPPSGPYQNRLQVIPPVPTPGLLPVQLPPVAFECPPNQYVSPIYQQVPPVPVASATVTGDPICITGSASVQSQHPAPVSSEYSQNTPGVVVQKRQSHQVLPVQAGYYQVPDPNLPAESDSDTSPTLGQTLVPVDLTNVGGMYVPNMVFEYPVNFAQYYMQPDPSLYNNANVEDLRSYLERRTHECHRLQRQYEDTSRVRNIT